MTEPEIVLVGRSSSHFTRTARIFALELKVPHRFRPVLDITAMDPALYGGNPALKVPVLVDEKGPLFGTENICRELTRRSGRRQRVVLRGDVTDRQVANAEELVLHAMSSGVTLIMVAGAPGGGPAPAKVWHSLEDTLAFLDQNLEKVRAALPPERLISFLEASLFCLITHLPFRKLMDVSGYRALQAFREQFEQRPSARSTTYHFDRAGGAEAAARPAIAFPRRP